MNNDQASNAPLSLDALEQQLHGLIEQGQHRFEPARFEFIKALLSRSKNSRPAISATAIQQLANRIDQYQQRFQHAQQQAQLHCQTIEQHSASFSRTAQQLFEQQQFKAVSRLHQRLARQRQHQQQPSHGALQQLTQSLLQDHSPEAQAHTSHLDQKLQQFEATVSATLINNGDDSSNDPSDNNNRVANQDAANRELKSIALFRASWAKRHIDNLANQAINNRPDNAGPLNPERLASGSLSRIKALSPRYLNRFIGYVDTLLWLQQTEQQQDKAVKKNKG